MPNESEYVLYHTEGCHLCELALVLVEQSKVNFKHIDICEVAELAQRYGTSIPVFANGQREICWPFNASELARFLGE